MKIKGLRELKKAASWVRSIPDQAQREAIWRSVFPATTPLADIDPARLAKLSVTGGTIRNIALSAAFLAADAGTAVTMAHLRGTLESVRAALAAAPPPAPPKQRAPRTRRSSR